MIQRDYIMRLISMLTQVILRVLKLKEQKQYDAALDELSEAFDELFAAEAKLLRVVDAETAAHLLGHWQKVKILATLYREEGEIYALQNNTAAALNKLEQAGVLFGEAMRMKGSRDEECEQAASDISTKLSELSG